jgi:hypothetical protein
MRRESVALGDIDGRLFLMGIGVERRVVALWVSIGWRLPLIVILLALLVGVEFSA